MSSSSQTARDIEYSHGSPGQVWWCHLPQSRGYYYFAWEWYSPRNSNEGVNELLARMYKISSMPSSPLDVNKNTLHPRTGWHYILTYIPPSWLWTTGPTGQGEQFWQKAFVNGIQRSGGFYDYNTLPRRGIRYPTNVYGNLANHNSSFRGNMASSKRPEGFRLQTSLVFRNNDGYTTICVGSLWKRNPVQYISSRNQLQLDSPGPIEAVKYRMDVQNARRYIEYCRKDAHITGNGNTGREIQIIDIEGKGMSSGYVYYQIPRDQAGPWWSREPTYRELNEVYNGRRTYRSSLWTFWTYFTPVDRATRTISPAARLVTRALDNNGNRPQPLRRQNAVSEIEEVIANMEQAFPWVYDGLIRRIYSRPGRSTVQQVEDLWNMSTDEQRRRATNWARRNMANGNLVARYILSEERKSADRRRELVSRLLAPVRPPADDSGGGVEVTGTRSLDDQLADELEKAKKREKENPGKLAGYEDLTGDNNNLGLSSDGGVDPNHPNQLGKRRATSEISRPRRPPPVIKPPSAPTPSENRRPKQEFYKYIWRQVQSGPYDLRMEWRLIPAQVGDMLRAAERIPIRVGDLVIRKEGDRWDPNPPLTNRAYVPSPDKIELLLGSFNALNRIKLEGRDGMYNRDTVAYVDVTGSRKNQKMTNMGRRLKINMNWTEMFKAKLKF